MKLLSSLWKLLGGSPATPEPTTNAEDARLVFETLEKLCQGLPLPDAPGDAVFFIRHHLPAEFTSAANPSPETEAEFTAMLDAGVKFLEAVQKWNAVP